MRRSFESGLSVRPVSAVDGERLCEMLSRLSPHTIYERFHAPYPRVPGWMLAGMLEADHHDRESLVAGVGGEIVGHAMYARERATEAEFAVVVEDAWRSKGVGRLLLGELAVLAADRGIEVFTGWVLGENRRALGALAAVFPGMRHVIRDGTYLVRAPLPAVSREAVAERSA